MRQRAVVSALMPNPPRAVADVIDQFTARL
jgi:hypothetical protein